MAIEAQLAGARDLLKTELRRIVSSTQTELKRAVQLEQELAARLAQLKVRQGDVSNELVTLRELEREASAKRAVYEAFLLRARETGEQSDLSTVNMSVISKANPPLDANPPSRSTMALTGLLLGFLTGVGFGGVRGAYESLRETANERSSRKQREFSGMQPVSPRQNDFPQSAGVLPSHRGRFQQALPAAMMEPASEWPMPDMMRPADASYGVGAQHQADPENQRDNYAAGHSRNHPQPPIYQPIHPGAYVQPQSSYPYPRPSEHMSAADYPVDMQGQPFYPAAPRHFAPHRASPPPYASDTDSQASIDEIRSSLREFREAVRDLAETRARRRYF
ncbi:MAG: hypothetical protein H0T56_14050 [Pseudaminobacter sp.]|nr:hypothetical protein [Pseudaminobacter sp.]